MLVWSGWITAASGNWCHFGYIRPNLLLQSFSKESKLCRKMWAKVMSNHGHKHHPILSPTDYKALKLAFFPYLSIFNSIEKFTENMHTDTFIVSLNLISYPPSVHFLPSIKDIIRLLSCQLLTFTGQEQDLWYSDRNMLSLSVFSEHWYNFSFMFFSLLSFCLAISTENLVFHFP